MVTTDNDQTPSARDGDADQPARESASPNSGQAPAQAEAASELDQVKAERDKTREQLLRTAAEFDNFRKRAKRDLDDARLRAKEDVVRDMLPVFDNLERALSSGTGASDVESVLEGVRMVLKLFEDTAERIGVARVKSVGERFDPAVHEALQQQETDEHPPGTIIAEVAPGYRFGERLVRPAMVVVSRKPAAPKPSEPAQSNGKGSDSERHDADKTE